MRVPIMFRICSKADTDVATLLISDSPLIVRIANSLSSMSSNCSLTRSNQFIGTHINGIALPRNRNKRNNLEDFIVQPFGWLFSGQVFLAYREHQKNGSSFSPRRLELRAPAISLRVMAAQVFDSPRAATLDTIDTFMAWHRATGELSSLAEVEAEISWHRFLSRKSVEIARDLVAAYLRIVDFSELHDETALDETESILLFTGR